MGAIYMLAMGNNNYTYKRFVMATLNKQTITFIVCLNNRNILEVDCVIKD